MKVRWLRISNIYFTDRMSNFLRGDKFQELNFWQAFLNEGKN